MSEWLMRSTTADEFGLKKLQNDILNIMNYIDRFCEEHDIQYCLMGGSLLGAKRHGGFIPWDDDLDIFMTPDNYEKFRSLFHLYGDKGRFYLQEKGVSDHMITTAKIRKNNSSYIEEDLKNWKIHHGVFVDIFILHHCPDNKFRRLIQYFFAKYIILKSLANRDYKRKKGIVMFIIKCMRLLPKRFLLNFALKQVYKYRDSATRYYCNYLGKALLKNGTYKKEYFSGFKKVPFENIVLSVPDGIELFLKDRFGDYMKMPSAHKIKYDQHADTWMLHCESNNPDKESFPDEINLI